MSEKNKEVERLVRIRDQQLRARDPQKEIRRLQHGIAERHKRSRRKFSLGTLLQELPNKWYGLLIGALFGIAASFIVPLFVDFPKIELISYVFIPFIMIIGFAAGSAIDSREEIEDLINDRRRR